MITSKPLVQVKAMSKAMAKQVQVAPNNSDEWKAILEALRTDMTRPTGWASGEIIDGIPDNTRAWLVQYPFPNGDYWWIAAPYGGKVTNGVPDWMKVCTENLTQIFVG